MKLRAKIVGQTEIRQAFIDQALSNPSADIAENLLGLGDGRGYSELGKRGSQPAATAQKQFCRISIGRWRGGRARRSVVCRRGRGRPQRGKEYRRRRGLDHSSHDQIIPTTVAVIVAVASQPMARFDNWTPSRCSSWMRVLEWSAARGRITFPWLRLAWFRRPAL